MFACKCLNIIIRSASSRLTDVDDSFKENLGVDMRQEDVGVVDYEELVFKLPNLVEERIETTWSKFRCKNCGLLAYALSKELGGSKALVNKQMLMDASKIESVRRDESFSPVFEVLINRHYRDSFLPPDKYELLHPIAVNWLKEKTEQTEERIRKFMDKQYEELDQLRIQAHQDQRALSRAMSWDKFDRDFSPGKYSMPTSPSKKAGDGGKTRDKDIFDFEEYDDGKSDKLEGSGRSEDSDMGEGFDEEPVIERTKHTAASMARSLPIPVPQFLEERNPPNKINRSPQTPSDIAASIKALAKSIHEEGIFGELPRPRFTTNL